MDIGDYLKATDPTNYGSYGTKVRMLRIGKSGYTKPNYGQITNPTEGHLPTHRAAGRRIPNVTAGVTPTFNRPWQGDSVSHSGYDGTSDRRRSRDNTPSLGESIVNYTTARSQRKAVLAEQQRGVEALAYARSKGIPDAPGLKGSPLTTPPTLTDDQNSAYATQLAQSRGIPAPPNAKGGPLAPPPAPAWNTQAPNAGSLQPPPPTLSYITNTANPHYRPPVINNLGYITNTMNPHSWNAKPPSGAPQSPPGPSNTQYVGPGRTFANPISTKTPYVGPGSSVWPMSPSTTGTTASATAPMQATAAAVPQQATPAPKGKPRAKAASKANIQKEKPV